MSNCTSIVTGEAETPNLFTAPSSQLLFITFLVYHISHLSNFPFIQCFLQFQLAFQKCTVNINTHPHIYPLTLLTTYHQFPYI